MDKSYFLELLRKYVKGEASLEEEQFLISYYNLFESEPELVALLNESQRQALKNKLQNDIWQTIDSHEKQLQPIRPVYKRRILQLAAAAVLLTFCTLAILYLVNRPSKQQKPAVVQTDQPKQNRLLRLPDGSTVIVNAGSTLHFPASFNGLAKREVYLEGVAYFDIQHNESQPFIVHTGKIVTTVLGTAFEVKAWPGETNITVTVTRGKVKVGEDDKTFGIITPDQQITYDKRKAAAVQSAVDADKQLLWKQQDLLLDNVTVVEAAALLEQRYGVTIQIADSTIQHQQFTTTFMKDESLEHVLTSICEFNDATYRYNQETATVVISSK